MDDPISGRIFELIRLQRNRDFKRAFVRDFVSTVLDSEGRTLLHHAAACGNLEIVQFLLLNGASLDSKDSVGLTPIEELGQRLSETDRELEKYENQEEPYEDYLYELEEYKERLIRVQRFLTGRHESERAV